MADSLVAVGQQSVADGGLTNDREETAGNSSASNEAENDDSEESPRALGRSLLRAVLRYGRHVGLCRSCEMVIY